MYNSQPVRSSNPVVNVLKNVGASPLFLTAVILYTVSAAGSAILRFVGASDPSAALNQALSAAYAAGVDVSPLVPYLNSASSGFTVGTVVGSVLGLIPVALLCVGMWLTWATCRSMASGNVSTAGLTLCRVILLIYQVLLVIALVLMGVSFLLLLLGLAGGITYGYGYGAGFGVMMAIFLVMVLIVTAVFVLLLCFYISAVRAVTRIRATALTGQPDNRISSFLLVMIWIMAVLGALSGLSMLGVSPLAGVLSLVGAAASILVAISLRKYREEMTRLMPVPVSPYAQPYQPVQPGYPQTYGRPGVSQQPPYQPQGIPPMQNAYQMPPQQPVQAPAQQLYQQAPVQNPTQQPAQPSEPQDAGNPGDGQP